MLIPALFTFSITTNDALGTLYPPVQQCIKRVTLRWLQYDDRMGSSADRLNLLLDSSCRAGEAYGSFSSTAAISEVF